MVDEFGDRRVPVAPLEVIEHAIAPGNQVVGIAVRDPHGDEHFLAAGPGAGAVSDEDPAEIGERPMGGDIVDFKTQVKAALIEEERAVDEDRWRGRAVVEIAEINKIAEQQGEVAVVAHQPFNRFYSIDLGFDREVFNDEGIDGRLGPERIKSANAVNSKGFDRAAGLAGQPRRVRRKTSLDRCPGGFVQGRAGRSDALHHRIAERVDLGLPRGVDRRMQLKRTLSSDLLQGQIGDLGAEQAEILGRDGEVVLNRPV